MQKPAENQQQEQQQMKGHLQPSEHQGCGQELTWQAVLQQQRQLQHCDPLHCLLQRVEEQLLLDWRPGRQQQLQPSWQAILRSTEQQWLWGVPEDPDPAVKQDLAVAAAAAAPAAAAAFSILPGL
jgi:hypothetical protein